MTASLGIADAIAATYIGQALGLSPVGRPAGFIASILGAIVLRAAYHCFTRSSTAAGSRRIGIRHGIDG